MKSEAKNSFLLKPLVGALMTVRGKPAGFGLLATLPALAMAQTLPTGGQVVAGNANISQPNAGSMVINQSSDKAIINWQGFSIGANGYVQFVMPGSGSISLNRVVGQDPSSILGHLSSNGQVFLVNPNGVYFGANATVDVAGIVASTMNIRNEDFMRGDFRFRRDPNAPANATVINAGSINANGGYVVLAGDYVSNTGLIQAQLGTALLASGNALTLQLAGSSLVNYAIDEATLAQLAGVNNAGQILASGGKVIMTAEVANQLAGTVVNNSGLVQAQGTVEKDGAIYLTGKGGDVVNSGTLDAGGGQNGKAGSVQMVASGDLVHEAGSLITVDGAQQGVSNGGSIHTWADGKNRFKQGATITARGGAQGGDGGFVELSGNSVTYRGKVDLLAAKGRGGTLLIDPTNITIKNGSGEDDPESDSATFYETNLESALAGSGQVVLQAQNSGLGNSASIVMEDLADNELTGLGTAGLTLKVSATNGATGSIVFQDKNDRIAVGGQLNLSVDDGAGNALPFSSIDVGHLQSKTGIDLKAGSIAASSLSVLNTTSTTTDASYAISARAVTGDLQVNGDVRLEVSNDQAAAVSTTVDLKADNGAVRIDGDVTSKATGLGYYNYNWVTGGGAATTYFGGQPWSIASQGDHAISTSLSIVSGGNSDIVIGGSVQALATDNNTAFTANSTGGYWQTATTTTHNFWRPTAASAQATIAAGGNVTIGGNTAVKADGYATSAYSETESWRQMVENFNYTSGTQTVFTDYGCVTNDVPCSGGYNYRSSYVYTDNRLKGSATGNYIWQFGSYTSSLPGVSYNSPTVYSSVDSSFGSLAGPMGYTGARGLTANLNVTAGKSVTMGGLDVRATNRSANGSGSYTDVNWGRQDTASNLNGTGNSFTSNNREIDYYDSFSTSYSAASTDAQASITAGAGSAITINGSGANVVASNTVQGASSSIDFAKLSLVAGSGSGDQGSAIQLNSPVRVQGSSDRSIDLIVQNRDGAINQDAAANIDVVNQYWYGDASASLTSDRASTNLGAVSVAAGANATLTAKANTDLDLGGNLSASSGDTAIVNAEATQGQLNAHGTIGASANTASITLKSGTDMVTDGAITATANSPSSATVSLSSGAKLTTNAAITASAQQFQVAMMGPFYNVIGGAASVSLSSVGDMAINANVAANGYRLASLNVATQDGALTLASGKSISSTASGAGFDPLFYIYSYSSSLNLSAGSGMTLDGSVTSSALAGSASMNLKTLGGADATLTQGAGSAVNVLGRSAGLIIKAGNDQSTVADMAAANLNGALNVSASQADANLQVEAASGTVNGFGVTSTIAKAKASFSARNGDLAMIGSGSVTGNANASDGATLTVSSSGVLQAGAASLNVTNNNTGVLSAASASFTAGSGVEESNVLGAVAVRNNNSATLSATVSGDLQVSGAISATAAGTNGQAQVTLGSSQGAVEIADTGSVSAVALTTGGNASIGLTGLSGLTVNGNLQSKAGNLATVNLTSTGGNEAAISQGATSEIKAAGATATVNLNAGNATPDAQSAAGFTLAGALKAEAGSGSAAVNVKGKSGSVHDITASSTGSTAAVQVQALNGDLNLDGSLSLSGNANSSSGAQLGLSALGALDTSAGSIALDNSSTGSLAASNATLQAGGALNLGGISVFADKSAALNASSDNGDLTVTAGILSQARAPSGGAQVDLSANQGSLTVNAGKSVAATGPGGASTTLTAANGMQIDGAVSANAINGMAGVSLSTTGGAAAGINQGSASNIGAYGRTASLAINGGAASPDADTAAALDLAGALNAVASAGDSSLTLKGKSVSAKDLNASSTNGGAALAIDALNGDLTLNGSTTVSGVTNSNGVTLNLASSGVLDTSAASISMNNLSDDTQAGLLANLNAGAALTLGDFSLTARQSAILNATSTGLLTAAGDIGVMAYATTGSAQLNLSANQGNLKVNADKTVGATSSGSASTSLQADLGMQIDGNVSANGINGTATTILATLGGADAAIVQGSNSNISSEGATAVTKVQAGVTPVADQPDTYVATVDLGGMVKSHAYTGSATTNISAASGRVTNAQATADNGIATVNLAATDSSATLHVNGLLQANGKADALAGAVVHIEGAGAVDATAGSIAAINSSSGSDAQATASIYANGGDLLLGTVTASGTQSVIQTESAGQTTVQGALNSNGLGSAVIDLTSAGQMNLQSNLHATASAGVALVSFGVADANPADIVQGANSTLTAEGLTAGLIGGGVGGKLNLGGNTIVNGSQGATMMLAGRDLEVKDFSVQSTSGQAQATLFSVGGSVLARGTGSVTGAGNQSAGAALGIISAAGLDTRSANLTVSNTGNGESAGAQLVMTAGAGLQAGALNANTAGGGEAIVALKAHDGLALSGDVAALATGSGNATVSLQSGVQTGNFFMPTFLPAPQPQLTGTITQAAGTLVKANANTGDAMVDLQVGNCCSGNIALAGTVEAKVADGAGNASIAMRGTQITANQLRANTGLTGSGDAAISLIASDTININGVVDLQAKNRDARADLQLVADKLNWSGASTLSDNNAHIQLAPFSPDRLIGVDSDQDFDATVQTNYSQTMLKNFMGHGAEVTFGGVVDRSAFTRSTLKNLIQQSADIHVAANGPLNLGDVKMVFDTTGTTYYHDPRMSPWSVPSGRVAVFVARPNVDRYLDRTENTLQNMTRSLENNNPASGSGSTPPPGGSGPVTGTTHVSGNLYMAGNGVNMDGAAQNGKGDGAGPGAGGQSGKPAAGEQPEQDGERKRQSGTGQAG